MAARVRNWRELDAAHRKRGELITVVFDPSGTAFQRPAYHQRTGTPRQYSDALIEALLACKVLLRLSLRALQGFAQGLAHIAGASWTIPNYTTLCRRMAALDVDLRHALPEAGNRVLMVDSTGLKVFGAGEWKVRQHGTDGKRRTWRKIHILVDRETGHVIAVETTDRDTGDATVLPALLPTDIEGDFVLGDGAYHTKKLHRTVYAKGATLLSPPSRNARVWKPYHHMTDEPAFRFRNAQLTPLQRLGRTEWKIQSGCSKRSYVESMMHRLKSLTGDRLASRSLERQKVEVRLRCQVLNATATSTWSPTA